MAGWSPEDYGQDWEQRDGYGPPVEDMRVEGDDIVVLYQALGADHGLDDAPAWELDSPKDT